MRPPPWPPPRELSSAAQAIVARIWRARLFVCLRRLRHELFSAAFQAALASIFQDRSKGQPPVPPAPLALVPLLPAYTGASDDEIEITVESTHKTDGHPPTFGRGI